MKIILALLVLSVAACSSDSLQPSDWKYAERLCEPHGGVKAVSAMLNLTATCRNLVIIEAARPRPGRE